MGRLLLGITLLAVGVLLGSLGTAVFAQTTPGQVSITTSDGVRITADVDITLIPAVNCSTEGFAGFDFEGAGRAAQPPDPGQPNTPQSKPVQVNGRACFPSELP